jgi:hypothetical protein
VLSYLHSDPGTSGDEQWNRSIVAVWWQEHVSVFNISSKNVRKHKTGGTLPSLAVVMRTYHPHLTEISTPIFVFLLSPLMSLFI